MYRSSPKRSRSQRPTPKNIIYFFPSEKEGKKYSVKIDNKTVHFGAKNYSDYTLHKDKERMIRYTNRHKNRENWNKSGIKTAGFWAKHALWNKPSLKASLDDIEKRFKVKIIRRRPKK